MSARKIIVTGKVVEKMQAGNEKRVRLELTAANDKGEPKAAGRRWWRSPDRFRTARRPLTRRGASADFRTAVAKADAVYSLPDPLSAEHAQTAVIGASP